MGVNYIQSLFDQFESLFATVRDVHLVAFFDEHRLHHSVIESLVIDHKHRGKLSRELTNDGVPTWFV